MSERDEAAGACAVYLFVFVTAFLSAATLFFLWLTNG